ncbi:MAG: hypothetical protein ABR555_14960 [Pyrinomonadaceae bacterium]
MADDRMKNDDLDKNLGSKRNQGGSSGQQTPGRHKEDDEPFGQRGGGQGTSGREKDYGSGAGGHGNQPGGKTGSQGGRQTGMDRGGSNR